MIIKSNKELSFGSLVDKGLPREEIMKLKGIQTDAEYERIYASLLKARERVAEKKLEAEKKAALQRRG